MPYSFRASGIGTLFEKPEPSKANKRFSEHCWRRVDPTLLPPWARAAFRATVNYIDIATSN